MPENTGVGERIRKRRIELGYTQDTLAERMGYRSKTTICKVESGIDNITSTRLEKFAEALHCTPAFLMGWEDDAENEYYINEETQKMAQKIATNKELRGLFDAAQTATPEDLQTVHMMLLALKKKEKGD